MEFSLFVGVGSDGVNTLCRGAPLLAWLAGCALRPPPGAARGPGTRLWSLRTEQKLAYNVAASALQMKSGGLFEAYLETDPSNKARAKEAMAAALAEVRDKGLSEEELATAKAGLKSLFLRGNETKISRASTLASFQALGLGSDFFEAFAAEVDAVTLDEINAHARNTLDPAKAHWVLVGPKS